MELRPWVNARLRLQAPYIKEAGYLFHREVAARLVKIMPELLPSLTVAIPDGTMKLQVFSWRKGVNDVKRI
jgi:hypothetical protein